MRKAAVGVRELEISCVLGVNPEERERNQRVVVSVEFEYDAEAAARRDDIRDAINYDRVVRMVREHMSWQKYGLMEAAASGIISMLQDAYPDLLMIEVEIAKPEALPEARESYCRMIWSVPGSGQNRAPRG